MIKFWSSFDRLFNSVKVQKYYFLRYLTNIVILRNLRIIFLWNMYNNGPQEGYNRNIFTMNIIWNLIEFIINRLCATSYDIIDPLEWLSLRFLHGWILQEKLMVSLFRYSWLYSSKSWTSYFNSRFSCYVSNLQGFTKFILSPTDNILTFIMHLFK